MHLISNSLSRGQNPVVTFSVISGRSRVYLSVKIKCRHEQLTASLLFIGWLKLINNLAHGMAMTIFLTDDPFTSWMMRPAIAPGPTVHWLFRSHDLPSKFSQIVSRMCDRRNRAVKHTHVSPLLRKNFVVSVFILCLTSFYRGNTWIIQKMLVFAICQHVN